MKQITIKEMRLAVSYVFRTGVSIDAFSEMSDTDFLKLDLSKDLQMGNIRFHNIVIELERVHNIGLPLELYKLIPDNTVGALMNTINRYLEQKISWNSDTEKSI
jgi:hypothetical protein